LDQALAGLPRQLDPRVLIGFETSDDAGVFQLTPECALVQTVDFFTPIVDDPYTFGQIAAANSLSDVYAMGGEPISALSILAWPRDGEMEDLRAVLRGGAEKMIEAGCSVIGGHSIADAEPKFGYAVTGTVHPARVLANGGARVGDVLVLTKRLGTGIV
jgi:selenide,water dikinase